MSKTRAVKFFLSTKSEVDDRKAQSSIITLINDGTNVITNSYGKINTREDIGDYSFAVTSNQATLDFFPIDNKINDYTYGFVYYDTKKYITESSSSDLGDIVSIASSNTYISSGITTTIFKIPEKFGASKLIVELSGSKNKYEFVELNLTSTDTDIFSIEYGRLNLGTNSLSGIGTYDFYRDESNNINLDFSPLDASENYTSNVVAFSLAKIPYVESGEKELSYANFSADSISIEASSTPTQQVISTYPIEYQSAYFIVQIYDLTNDRVQFSELLTTSNLTEASVIEYGKITSNGDIGSLDANISGIFELYFTPNPNIDVEIKIFKQTLSYTKNPKSSLKIDLKNSSVVASVSRLGYSDDNNNKTNFNLTHNGVPIFERAFDASSSSIIDLSENSIYLPNHFFVTGEKILYKSNEFDPDLNNNSIGIVTTFISGIGNTNKLPETCYVYKFNNSRIGLCASPVNAFSYPPILFDFTSLGIETKHFITSIKQNAKSLICIDNLIQSPIVGTSITTTLSQNLSLSNTTVAFSGISSFFAGDLIQIDQEIMKVEAVQTGSTNYATVKRPWLGTEISSHNSGKIIQKLKGNYNIIKNTIYFDFAPYGPTQAEAEYDTSDSTAVESLVQSTFQGRVFMRSADPTLSYEAYDKNYIFDDISNGFNSSQKIFDLKQQSNSLNGIYEDGSIILINNVFQTPTEDVNLTEVGSNTKITFTGSATSVAYDPNNASIPRGGIIVSVGSTAGFGYQPLVSAGGTAIVSISGTIQGVSIGNSGSGYRRDLQVVRVGVQTSDANTVNIEFIGTATVSNGGVIGIAITNAGVGYTSYQLVGQTNTTEIISAASTEIFLNDISIIPEKYPVISIESIIENVHIVGIGTSSVFISSSDAPISPISSDSQVNIKKYNPPKIVFDAPLSYSDIPLKYSGVAGIGTEATIDVVVGQGSSIIDFTIKNYGYSYSVGDVLTLPTNGVIGIPTLNSFNEFKLTVAETYTDSFSGWSVGSMVLLDDISGLINNKKRIFPLSYQGNRFSIVSQTGSNIDVKAVLLVFINDILQEPGVGYSFNGGSIITFPEPLKVYPNGDKDKCKLIFYRGTNGIDVKDIDILETVKQGDFIELGSDNYNYKQQPRLVEDIISVDVVKTNLYNKNGISDDVDTLRPITWSRQRQDLVIQGKQITKDRPIYEPSIFPTTNILKSIGTGTTQIYVSNVKTIFDNKKENNTTDDRNVVEILSLDDTSGIKMEVISDVSYSGDFGIITGIATTSIIGVAQTGLIFDLAIESDSPLRNLDYVDEIIGISNIKQNYFFEVYNSNIGYGLNSIGSNNAIIGIGTTSIDNVYEVVSVSIGQTHAYGIGLTDVAKVVVRVQEYNNLTGFGFSNFYGNYSWGLIEFESKNRKTPKQFLVTQNYGVVGLNSTPIVRRKSPLKYFNYLT